MKVGTRVRVKPGWVFSGRTGKIHEIFTGPSSGKIVAEVLFDKKIPGHGRQIMGFFLNKLEDISKPIKLKKFSAWK